MMSRRGQGREVHGDSSGMPESPNPRFPLVLKPVLCVHASDRMGR